MCIRDSNSTIQVSGVYQGSTPDPNAPQGPLTLNIADAIRRGLRFNLGAIDVYKRQGKIKATNRAFKDDWVFAITVRNGKLTKIREYIDTQALARASEMDASGLA